jgi:Type I phosphodiesterase / nucleotide pyrophosphatase
MSMSDSPGRRRYDRAIFLLLDGARADVFHELLRAGELPNVARNLAEPGGATTATTVFPSVTGVAYAPYVTGCFPQRTNLTGVRWLDRELYARRKISMSRFRNYAGPGHFMMDRDMSREVSTLFELLRPSQNIFGTISRGTGKLRNAYLVRRVPMVLNFVFTGDWTPIDQRTGALLLRQSMRKRPNRFTFHTTLQVDEHSHMDGPFSPRVREGYRAFDRTLGALVARLRARGHLERTLIAMGADHGHSAVTHHFDLEGFFERRGLRTLYYGKQVKRWFGCDAAVMVGGNAIGHVYLRGAGWTKGETGVERLARHPGLVDELLAEPGVDILAYSGHHGVVHVRSRRGSAEVKLDRDHVTYEPHGGDPFGYGPLPLRMTRHEAIQLTQHSTYPDGPVQVAQIFGASRSGDLIVTSAPSWDLRERGDHRLHRSGHGSLHRDHMAVPFAMNHPFDIDAVRTVDAFPTILRLMGEPAPGDIDGRDLAYADMPDAWSDPDVEAPLPTSGTPASA